MTLTTLSGTITHTALNNNFSDKVSAINSNNIRNKKDFLYELDAIDVASGTDESLRVLDFTAPQDLEVIITGLTVYSPDATSRTTTMTLRAIDPASGIVIPRYTDGTDPDVSVVSNAAAEFSATRENFQSTSGDKLFLIEGVTYRITISVSTASVLDRVVAMVLCRARANRV